MADRGSLQMYGKGVGREIQDKTSEPRQEKEGEERNLNPTIRGGPQKFTNKSDSNAKEVFKNRGGLPKNVISQYTYTTPTRNEKE